MTQINFSDSLEIQRVSHKQIQIKQRLLRNIQSNGLYRFVKSTGQPSIQTNCSRAMQSRVSTGSELNAKAGRLHKRLPVRK